MKKKKINKDLKLLLKNVFRLLKIYFKMRPWFVLFYVLVMFCIAGLPFVVSYLNGQLINKVVMFLGDGGVGQIIIYQLLALAILAGLLLQIFYKLADLLDRFSTYDWNEKMPIDISRAISGLDLATLESSDFRTKLSRVRDGATYRTGNFVSLVFWMINDLVQIVMATVILSGLAFVLLPIIFVGLLPEFVILLQGSRAHWNIWGAKEVIRKRYTVAREKLQNENSIQEIRIFGARSYLLNMMKDLMSDFVAEQRKILKRENKLSVLARTFENVILGGIEFWVLLGVLARKWGVGDYNFYLSSINGFARASRNLLRNINTLYEHNLYITDFFEILDTKNKIVNKEGAVVLKTERPPKIEFVNVSFAYPGSKIKVFDKFSMTIGSGEDVAIVGENGAGKTTLVKLLSRFYDVDEGEILLDGVNIKEIDLESWYKNLGILFQSFVTYGFSAYENIGLGDVSKFFDKGGVVEAAKMAGADEFIGKLKRKYKQILSKWFTKGTELSGGQWQRVALARAFFRNANVLVLDEPTSAIDAKGEYEIFKKLENYQKEKTTIIISHRFSTVRKADKIYVIEKGKIIEQGSHEELMKKSRGRYKKMFELQAQGYR